jgi:hypothetical protein
MKRLFPSIPVFFLVLINACGVVDADSGVPSNMSTAVVQTLTATIWTPVPTQTFNANIPIMVNWLNADLSTVNSLEWSLDAEYYVTNVSFPNVAGSSALIFRVDVRCECINSDECCIPERTFVVLMGAMKRNANTLLTQIPMGVSEIMVVCSDHKTPVGAVSAPWQEAKAYLQGYLTGY